MKDVCIHLLPLVACAQCLFGGQARTLVFQGWPGAIELFNGSLSVVVVPQIGKIMNISATGKENIVWNNPSLSGLSLQDAAAREPVWGWANFGGDRFWVVQQSDNAQVSGGKPWPPDEVFDGEAWNCQLSEDGSLVLESGASPQSGVKAWRKMAFGPDPNLLLIRQKITAVGKPGLRPLNLIQNVTTLRKPDMVIFKMPRETHFPTNPRAGAESPFPRGVGPLSFPKGKEFEKFFASEGGYGFLSQPEKGFTGKIYLDLRTGWLAAVYGNQVYLQIFRYVPGAYYPDGGCSAEVYVSDYFEIEVLSPADVLDEGESIDFDIGWATHEIAVQGKTRTEIAAQCEELAQGFLKLARF
jgi:hypothetical protein